MANIRIPQDYKEDVNYSVHDLSLDKRTTMHTCLNIPILFKEMFPGDKFDVSFATKLQSNALLAPLMGRYKLRVNLFFEPLSNMYGWLDNNKRLSTQELLSRNKHRWSFTGVQSKGVTPGSGNIVYTPNSPYSQIKWDNGGSVNPTDNATDGLGRGGIFDYIGLPPGFVPVSSVGVELAQIPAINIEKLIAYLDVIRSYYVNRQEDEIPYVSPVSNIVSGGGMYRTFGFAKLKVSDLDDFMMWLRQQDDGVDLFEEDGTSPAYVQSVVDYIKGSLGGPCSGLFCAMYEPDYFSNFLSSDVGKVSRTVLSSGNNTTIHELYFQNKMQRLIDRYDVSGGVFSNWIRTVWGVTPSKSMDIPDLIGSMSTIIDTTNITITSNGGPSAEGSPDSFAGDMHGKIDQDDNKYNNKGKKFDYYVRADEQGYLVVMVSLVPLVDYCQNIQPDLLNTSFADDYKPQLSQLGYQDIIRAKYSALPDVYNGYIQSDGDNSASTQAADDIIGRQIAWLDLMTDTNRVHGEFSNFGYYDYWVLSRKFQSYKSMSGWYQNTIAPNAAQVVAQTGAGFDMSRYGNPLDWQFPFIATEISDPNYFFQIAFNIRAVRPIGKRFMPSLI